MMHAKQFNGQVMRGDQSGRSIGFRTANFDPSVVASEHFEKGVYASHVTVGNKTYLGVLYYGPRLVKGETHTVLEIHILSFDGNLYGKNIKFTFGKFIRGTIAFTSMDELRRQIEMDVAAVIASS